LLTHKVAGNASESGLKPTVWSLVVQAVAGATTDGCKKDALKCKTLSAGEFLFLITLFNFGLMVSLQLKGEYKQVKTLHSLSGFGWHQGDQMVMAPLAIWDPYVKV